jgi:hypothetical protein
MTDIDDSGLKLDNFDKEKKGKSKTPIKKIEPSSEGGLKVYVSSETDVPEGRTARRGSGGGLYYFTATRQPKQNKGDIEGAQKVVRVTGNGVGIIAGIVEGKLVVKSIKNKETGEFIKKVVACGGSEEHPGQFLACMRKIASDLELDISA